MGYPTTTAVLLAAGRGTRFGGNKLEAMLGDTMLGLHAARTLVGTGCGPLFAVHNPAHAALAAALIGEGFTLLTNENVDAGQSHSLALAAKAALTTDAGALLICLADMPLVTRDHLSALCVAHHANPDRIIASQADEIRSPPAIFPRAMWGMLASLDGDAGARGLLKDALCVNAPAPLLVDVDTPAALAAIKHVNN